MYVSERRGQRLYGDAQPTPTQSEVRRETAYRAGLSGTGEGGYLPLPKSQEREAECVQSLPGAIGASGPVRGYVL